LGITTHPDASSARAETSYNFFIIRLLQRKNNVCRSPGRVISGWLGPLFGHLPHSEACIEQRFSSAWPGPSENLVVFSPQAYAPGPGTMRNVHGLSNIGEFHELTTETRRRGEKQNHH
jgi:hypothetical protein